jgi:hypothetical protein
MKFEFTEMHWLDARQSLTLAELAELSGLPATELADLVDNGILTPLEPAATEVCFGADCLATARTAARLRADFELQPSGLTLALTLLERVRALEAQLRHLQACLPRYSR